MRILFSAIVALFSISCNKEAHENQNCYKGRFVGDGCWAVIEVLETQNDNLPTSQYGEYEHTFGTMNLPEQYKNGKPFYFRVNVVDSNKIYLTYCIPTKYVAEISELSDQPCSDK